MPDVTEVECKYCGSYIEVAKAVRLNTETGEYEYACEGCAIKWAKKTISVEEFETGVDHQNKLLK